MSASRTNRLSESPYSVVIPTTGRPQLRRAVASALEQTLSPAEILIMADTTEWLGEWTHPSIKVVYVGPRAGGNVARQRGVEAASTPIVALLDDDDRWTHDKMERQFRMLSDHGLGAADLWIASSAVLVRGSSRDGSVWPSRVIEATQDVGDYLFAVHGWKERQGFMQASTYVFPRRLAVACPFDPSAMFHQDVGWLMGVRAYAPDLPILQSKDALVEYQVATDSVSMRITSDRSRLWALASLRDKYGASARVVGDYLCTMAVYCGLREQSIPAVLAAVRDAFRYGRPSPIAAAYALAGVARVATRTCLRKLAKRH